MFVPEILAELRDGQYAPGAWLRFLGRSFQQSVDDARNEPALLRSALRQSVLLEGIALALLLWPRKRHPASHSFRQVRRVSIAVLVQQGFVALHLGMAQTRHGTPRFATLGAANFLTSLRGVCALLLHSSDPVDLPLFALLCAVGSGTDALDGAVARRCGMQSRMGQMLDPATDVCFYSAAVNAAIARGALPRWFGWVLATRFLLPIGAGFYRYFRWAQPLEAVHTIWGKGAGALLTVLLGLSIVRPRTASMLCLPTSTVLVVAGALQCRRALQPAGWTDATGTLKISGIATPGRTS